MDGAILCLVGGVMLISMLFIASAIRIIPEHQRLAIYRLGRYIGKVGPGVAFLIPIVDRAVSINVQDEFAEAQAFQNMFGAIGKTLTVVHKDGEIEIDGKIWNAMSSYPIPPETRVRLKKVVVEVETIV